MPLDGRRTVWILNFRNEWERHDGGKNYRDALDRASVAVGDRMGIPMVVIVNVIDSVTFVERAESYPRPGTFDHSMG